MTEFRYPPCLCGHDEASHRHLDECKEEDCQCALFIPPDKEPTHE